MDISTRVSEVENWINERMCEADKISDWKFRLLCYYSILDAFVQEYFNYDKEHNRVNFINFIRKYQSKYSFLDEVDPVTLYYHYKKEIADTTVLNFMDKDKEYLVSEIQQIPNWRNIKGLLGDNKCNKHKYIELMYQLRNKLVHEFTTPDGVMGINLYDKGKTEPYYVSCEALEGNGNFVCYWYLTFSPQFICDLTRNVINNYLTDCKKNNCDPFKNNISRKMRLAWYD